MKRVGVCFSTMLRSKVRIASITKSLCLAAAGTLLGLSAYAQDAPKADLFLGYSFVRYNSAQTIPAFTANGGMGTFAWNFTNHLAIEAELGGYHNGNIHNVQLDSTAFSYLFGPRISYGRSKRIDPYMHVLFGGQNASTSIAKGSAIIENPVAGGSLFRQSLQHGDEQFCDGGRRWARY